MSEKVEGAYGAEQIQVLDGTRAVRVDRDVHAVAVACERLVDGVVDDLAHEVMQPPRIR